MISASCEERKKAKTYRLEARMRKVTGKQVKPKSRRHIEDIPFYKLKYKQDDLPLDPIKDFILEEISKSLFFMKFF